MNVLVLVKTLRLRELATAVLTLVRFLPGVVAHVGGVLRRKKERLGAETARIRALVGMSALVRVEVVDARESLATCVTRVRLITGMSANMEVQIADLAQTATMNAAGELHFADREQLAVMAQSVHSYQILCVVSAITGWQGAAACISFVTTGHTTCGMNMLAKIDQIKS